MRYKSQILPKRETSEEWYFLLYLSSVYVEGCWYSRKQPEIITNNTVSSIKKNNNLTEQFIIQLRNKTTSTPTITTTTTILKITTMEAARSFNCTLIDHWNNMKSHTKSTKHVNPPQIQNLLIQSSKIYQMNMRCIPKAYQIRK